MVRKLEAGLTALGKLSPENLALMLNLLGLSPPEGALAGLDGVLIGERTRALLSSLLEARSRASPTVLIIEDLHWVDGASEDLLGEIVGASDRFCALVLFESAARASTNMDGAAGCFATVPGATAGGTLAAAGLLPTWHSRIA